MIYNILWPLTLAPSALQAKKSWNLWNSGLSFFPRHSTTSQSSAISSRRPKCANFAQAWTNAYETVRNRPVKKKIKNVSWIGNCGDPNCRPMPTAMPLQLLHRFVFSAPRPELQYPLFRHLRSFQKTFQQNFLWQIWYWQAYYHTFSHTRTSFSPLTDKRRPRGQPQGNFLQTVWDR